MKLISFILAILLGTFTATAQEANGQNTQSSLPTTKSLKNPWSAHFGIQSDVHYSTLSSNPASPSSHDGRWFGQTYLSGQVQNRYISIGLRFEEMNHPFPGREAEEGWGLPYLSVKARYRWMEATLGDIYEQFGSGLLLRTYEERSLGIDNSLRGGRLQLTPISWLTVKVLAGQQRNSFDRDWKLFHSDRGYLYASDVEITPSQWFRQANGNNHQFQIGFSTVTKQDQPADITQMVNGQLMKLNQPEVITAWAGRLQWQHSRYNIYAEYAYKPQDPVAANRYIFKPGSVAMLTATYSSSNLSLFYGMRRSENFDFRSDRNATDTHLKINYLQPFTQQQTYTLAALYPYATQPDGEWAFQTELRFRIRKGTWLGGKYGMRVKLSASHIRALNKRWIKPEWAQSDQDFNIRGTEGYTTRFFETGDKLFQDIDLEISKKVSRTYQFTLAYMNQHYNQKLIEGHSENGDIIRSHIVVYDGKHKLSHKQSLRTEFQYLHTRQAQKDWLFALAEYSLQPHWMFTLSDQWNVGSTQDHYYMASLATIFHSHRIQLSYGKTRSGISCVGGICRMMPATQGLYLSYHYNF